MQKSLRVPPGLRAIDEEQNLAARRGSTKPNGRTTLVDVASRCGVSIYTVSHALRGTKGKVGEETRKRVCDVAKEMGYDPSRNQAARRLVLQKHGVAAANRAISVAMPKGFGEARYFNRLLDGILDVMIETSYEVHLTVLKDTNQQLPSVCARGEIDGLIVCDASDWFKWGWLRKLKREVNFGDRPIVGLIDPIPGCSSVHGDDYQAGYLAASHLLDLGHLHILHGLTTNYQRVHNQEVAAEEVYPSRISGMQQACIDRGLDVQSCMQSSELPHDKVNPEWLAPPMLELLRERPEITAICAPNDYAAVQIWRALVGAGLRVPEDISLISFDDTEEIFSPLGESILTTVRVPLYDIGREGARLLIRAINDEIKVPQNIVLSDELVIRKSTAPPSKR